MCLCAVRVGGIRLALPCRCRGWCVGGYIRYLGDGGYGFRPYGGSLWKSTKVTKGLLPHHSAPRLGSVCPNAGLNPWVTRQDAGLAALGQGGPGAAPRGFRREGGHAEPRRGTEWWG